MIQSPPQIILSHLTNLMREVIAGILLVGVFCGVTNSGIATAGSVILWNTLDSDSAVLASEIGPGGTIIGGDYAYEPAQFGNGYIRKAYGDNYISFPSSVIDQLTHRGTIALWINSKVETPVPYDYGIFGLVGTPYGWAYLPSNPSSNISLAWGDGVTGLGIYGSLNFGSTAVHTTIEPFQFVATPGVPFHVAMSWDIDGIDGTTDTIRVYRNGQLIGTTTDAWDPNGTQRNDIVLGYSPDHNGYDKFIVNNLVIYDFAKTNFSDRFHKSPLRSLDVGGSVTGIIPEIVTCFNETATQSVEVMFEGTTSWNCETEGLLVDLSDRIIMSVEGTVPLGDVPVFGSIDVRGTVSGIIPEAVDCLNETTEQNVEVPLEGSTSFNCEAEGLLVDHGDRIIMTVAGTVPRDGDITSNGCIDRTDANILLEYARNSVSYDADYDLNDDGLVNIADVRTLVLLFDNPGGASCD
jgi:hypothetical protein